MGRPKKSWEESGRTKQCLEVKHIVEANRTGSEQAMIKAAATVCSKIESPYKDVGKLLKPLIKDPSKATSMLDDLGNKTEIIVLTPEQALAFMYKNNFTVAQYKVGCRVHSILEFLNKCTATFKLSNLKKGSVYFRV